MENHQCGGIIGGTWINNYIQGCYNSENVSGNEDVGGIVGNMYCSDEYTSEILNCYNTGNISSGRIVGGIVGKIYGDNNNIKYCYNVGKIKGNGSSNFKGSIVGSRWSGIIQNCYYLNTIGIKAVENKDDEANNVYGLESSYMKTENFVNVLNGNNEETNVWKLAEGNYEYPVLNWQTTYPDFIEKILLTGIQVTKEPTNTTYIEGQNFNPAGMKVTATYNDGTSKEVTSYTVIDGNNLTAGKTSITISYTENEVTKTTTQRINVTEKLQIEINEYTENKEENVSYIEDISPSTTIENMISKIKTNGQIEIFKGTEKITDKNVKIATGMKIKITLNDENIEYTAVVKGDLTGDGEMGDADLLRMARYKAGLDKKLTGAYLKATDINNNNENADDIDLLKLVRILVGLDWF